MMENKTLLGLVIVTALSCWLATAQADVVTLDDYDSSTVKSFDTAGNWSDSQAPHTGDDYLVQEGRHLRVRVSHDFLAFKGDSLTIDGAWLLGGTYSDGGVIVNDLQLKNGGGVANNLGTDLYNVNGTITLGTGGGVFAIWTATVTDTNIQADVVGSSPLTIWNRQGASATGFITLSGTNTYSGGTTIQQYANLDVQVDGGLGTGNVNVDALGTLKLNLGTTNDYIANAANLILANETSTNVTLDFTGTDTISGLSFDGGTTWAADGTWGAVGSGADHESAALTGSGLINVPEPTTLGLLLAGSFVLSLRRKRK